MHHIVKIRTNDMVRILTGKDRGKTGKVIQVFPQLRQVVVEGINTMVKHVKAPKSNEKGQKVEFNGPIDISNVMVVCPSCNKPSRIGSTTDAAGKKSRVCRRCKEPVVKS